MSRSGRARLAAEDLADVEVLGDAQISPDGRLVACCSIRLDLEHDRERSMLRLLAVDGEPQPLDLRHEGRSPRWSPDGSSIALLRGDDEGAALIVFSVADGSARTVTTLAGAADPVVWSPEGSVLAVTVAQDDGPSRIAIVDVKDGELRLLPGGHDDDSSPSWSADGSRLAFARSRRTPGVEGPSSSILVCAIEPEAEPAAIETGLGFSCCPSWSPSGETLAIHGNREARLGPEDPALQAWLVSALGGEARIAAKGVNGVIASAAKEGPRWSADGERVFFRAAREGDIDLIAARTGELGPVEALTRDCQLTGFSLAADGAVAFSACSPGDPGSVWLRGPDSPPRRLAGDPVDVPSTERRRVKGPDGELDAWIQGLGSGPAPQPLLVSMHGGPHNFVGSGFTLGHFHRNVLASRGWIVLTLNSSGSGSYGERFADSIRGRWGEKDLPEYLAAADALIQEGAADPDRLAVAGYSYGGYLTAWAISHSERFKAAVIGAPIANLESFEADSDIGPWYLRWEMGEEVGGERLRELSPVSHADRIKTPTLILHGEADERCPLRQGEELEERIAEAGQAEVQIVRYPGAGHLFYSRGLPSQRIDYNTRIVDWIEMHVPAAGPGS